MTLCRPTLGFGVYRPKRFRQDPIEKQTMRKLTVLEDQ